MSIQKLADHRYAVRWRDGQGRHRSRTFARLRAAEAFDRDRRDRRALGTLALDQLGCETLDQYVEGTWAPVHGSLLADKTRDLYALLYDRHVSPTLGGVPLRELTAEQIGRWQADRLAAGAPVESTRKALTLLGAILQRAVEGGRIGSNPQRLVRRASPQPTAEVRPLAPATIEAIRAVLPPRDATFVSLLGYAGLRPQEARALTWGHVGERTLTVYSPKTRRHRSEPRSVRLLAPLAQDLREWRLMSGRPGDTEPVIPAPHGGTWTEPGYERWIRRVWMPALAKLGRDYQRPYVLRHSFASLLLHEGRSVVFVARQLGHSTAVCLRTYGHVIEELDDAPRLSAEDAILAARGQGVRSMCVEAGSAS